MNTAVTSKEEILKTSRELIWRQGWCAGDAFHLVPRALALCTTGLESYTVPLDVAHHRAELRLLYPGGAVGGRRPADRDADDSQDLRLCLDGADRIFRHEKRVQLIKTWSSAGGRGLCEAF